MKRWLSIAFAGVLCGAGGCSFMGDVMHAEGDYARKVGDAFHRQAARRDAAKAKAARSSQASRKPASSGSSAP